MLRDLTVAGGDNGSGRGRDEAAVVIDERHLRVGSADIDAECVGHLVELSGRVTAGRLVVRSLRSAAASSAVPAFVFMTMMAAC